jgi:DNA-directed RNA polymerase sigma subunit (sigma70/sigma32)
MGSVIACGKLLFGDLRRTIRAMATAHSRKIRPDTADRNIERDKAIFALGLKGNSFDAIGAQFGISRERARQIYRWQERNAETSNRRWTQNSKLREAFRRGVANPFARSDGHRLD